MSVHFRKTGYNVCFFLLLDLTDRRTHSIFVVEVDQKKKKAIFREVSCFFFLRFLESSCGSMIVHLLLLLFFFSSSSSSTFFFFFILKLNRFCVCVCVFRLAYGVSGFASLPSPPVCWAVCVYPLVYATDPTTISSLRSSFHSSRQTSVFLSSALCVEYIISTDEKFRIIFLVYIWQW